MSLYCPRCDKPIAPDHRCLSRRHFFGLFAGAAAAVLAPKVIGAPAAPLRFTSRRVLAGDLLSIAATGTGVPPSWVTIDLVSQEGYLTYVSAPIVPGPFFIATRDYTVTAVRTLHSGGTVAQSTALSVTRGPR